MRRGHLVCIGLIVALAMTGCMAPMPEPSEIVAPEPIPDNSGEYLCPYTSDMVLADWVDKAINAKAGAAVGRMAGAYVGQKAVEQVPLVGGILGATVGEEIGRKIAIEASGGMDYIRSTSDLSFNDVNDMAVYLYAECSSHEHYQDALNATFEIYPDLRGRYYYAIRGAPRKPTPEPGETTAWKTSEE